MTRFETPAQAIRDFATRVEFAYEKHDTDAEVIKRFSELVAKLLEVLR